MELFSPSASIQNPRNVAAYEISVTGLSEKVSSMDLHTQRTQIVEPQVGFAKSASSSIRHGRGFRYDPSVRFKSRQAGDASIFTEQVVCCRNTEREEDQWPGDLEPLRETVWEQLSRILQSKWFVQSDKLSRFLRFVVEHVLEGDPTCLKEYLIGVEVYDRRPPYDPGQDSIVRTEARRLRSKLRSYYENEGKEDLVFIYLRPGSYIPAVHFNGHRLGSQRQADAKTSPSSQSPSVVTAILPFRDLSENTISSAYARGIPDELAYALMTTEGCTVISPSSLEYFDAQEHDLSVMMNRVGAQIAFEGSVRVERARLRVTARIVGAAGVQLWARRIDAEVETGNSFATEEQIAFALSDGFRAVHSSGTDLPQHLDRGV